MVLLWVVVGESDEQSVASVVMAVQVNSLHWPDRLAPDPLKNIPSNTGRASVVKNDIVSN